MDSRCNNPHHEDAEATQDARCPFRYALWNDLPPSREPPDETPK